jgi:hypothetical protein
VIRRPAGSARLPIPAQTPIALACSACCGKAQAAGRLVYRQTGDGTGEQVTLTTWKPEEHTELVVAPRLAGG